jgi:type VI secretion system VasD/TssJ family lipoprotein
MIVHQHWFFVAFFSLALVGCGQSPLSVRAVFPVNVNGEGESLPVKVRIYALRDDARFRSALFSDLWMHDRDALGDDRLQDPKVVIIPPTSPSGLPTNIDLGQLPEHTRFLGIMALYRQADEPDRRRVVLSVDLLGERIVELVDNSIVVYAQGDPSPVRPIPDPAKPKAEQPVAEKKPEDKSAVSASQPSPAAASTKSDGGKMP